MFDRLPFWPLEATENFNASLSRNQCGNKNIIFQLNLASYLEWFLSSDSEFSKLKTVEFDPHVSTAAIADKQTLHKKPFGII